MNQIEQTNKDYVVSRPKVAQLTLVWNNSASLAHANRQPKVLAYFGLQSEGSEAAMVVYDYYQLIPVQWKQANPKWLHRTLVSAVPSSSPFFVAYPK